MAMAADSSGILVEARAQGFKELYEAAKDFNPKLATNLRRRVRDAAKSTIPRLQQNIRNVGRFADRAGTKSHEYRPGELTNAMANALVVLVNTGKDPRVTIRERSSLLPEGKQMLARKWERKTSWRHPVFGTEKNGGWRGKWAEGITPRPVYPQLIESRPWFTWNMAEAMRETVAAMAKDVNAAPERSLS